MKVKLLGIFDESQVLQVLIRY